MTTYSILKSSLIAAVLTLAFTPSTLNAQIPDGQAQCNVPFAFEVGSAHFAPGVYTIGMLTNVTLKVSGNASGGFASMRPESNRNPAATGKVVFRRVGSQYFLREVWAAGSTDHLVAYQSKAEKHALKMDQAANHAPAANMEIALAQYGR